MLAVFLTGPTVTHNSLFLPRRWPKSSPELIAPTHGGMARLSWPEWLVTYQDELPAKRVSVKSITHASRLLTGPVRDTVNLIFGSLPFIFSCCRWISNTFCGFQYFCFVLCNCTLLFIIMWNWHCFTYNYCVLLYAFRQRLGGYCLHRKRSCIHIFGILSRFLVSLFKQKKSCRITTIRCCLLTFMSLSAALSFKHLRENSELCMLHVEWKKQVIEATYSTAR